MENKKSFVESLSPSQLELRLRELELELNLIVQALPQATNEKVPRLIGKLELILLERTKLSTALNSKQKG